MTDKPRFTLPEAPADPALRMSGAPEWLSLRTILLALNPRLLSWWLERGWPIPADLRQLLEATRRHWEIVNARRSRWSPGCSIQRRHVKQRQDTILDEAVDRLHDSLDSLRFGTTRSRIEIDARIRLYRECP